jgi:hypothetical protein
VYIGEEEEAWANALGCSYCSADQTGTVAVGVEEADLLFVHDGVEGSA